MKRLISLIDAEYHQLSLWYFVAFIGGIVFHFASATKQPFHILAGIILVSIVFAYRVRARSLAFHFVLMNICLFAVGVSIAEIRERNIHTPIINKMQTDTISGTVANIKPSKTGYAVILEDLKSKKLPKGLKVKVNIASDKMINIVVSDRLSLKAKLFPLQAAILPGSFDFGFYMYMQGVGASGYAISRIKKLKPKKNKANIFDSVDVIRGNIYDRLIEVLGVRTGNFIAAILIGQTSGIDRKTADDMRGSGVSHILSVSGLHLTLVAMLFFFVGRAVLNLVGPVAHFYDIKKIAGVFSILASFAYLFLSGTKIAATRAFIMTTIFIIGTMLGRSPHPMRSIFVAAFMILLMAPEYVFHPSFQLSFAAVLCLVSGYEFYLRNQSVFGDYKGAFASIKFYLIANIYSSLLASLATAPFVIFHFYNFANYSVLMNLVAIPLMSFGIMPLGIASLLLMLVGLDYYPLMAMGYMAEIITSSASWVVTLPGAIWHFGHIEQYALGVFVFGFFWLCIWQTRLRFVGFLPVMLSFLMMGYTSKPVLIYDVQYHNLGIKRPDDSLAILWEERLPDFTKDFWLNWYGGNSDAKLIKQHAISKQDLLFEFGSARTVSLNYWRCTQADVMIITSKKLVCRVKDSEKERVVRVSKISGLKSIAVYCNENGCRYKISKRKYRVK